MLRNERTFVGSVARRRLTTFLAVFLLSFAPIATHAQIAAGQQNVNEVAQSAGLAGANTDLPTIIGRIINIILGFMGIVLLLLILYSGYQWMTAGGDPKKIQEAKDRIRNAIIGLLIMACAWGITSFILSMIVGGVFGNNGGPGGSGGPGGGFPTGAGSLGAGVIESHLPARNATDVPRNTPVIVTFKQPIQLASLIAGYNDNGTPANLADDTVTQGVNDQAVKIYQTSAGEAQALTSAQVRVTFTPDRRTFVFRPVALLGNPSSDTGYTVDLKGGRSGVLLENGDLAFGGSFSGGYVWQFEVGTLVDTTPPKVESVVPIGGNQYARNIVLQITFNEAVDPTAVSGFVTGGAGFQNIQVRAGGVSTASLDGQYRMFNRYRTVEFTPAQSCGLNSCGRDMFCLPGNAVIDAVARAATLNAAGPMAQIQSSGYDGVVDVVGNSLDGNGDGVAQGQGADNYAWAFGTSDDVNRAAPVLEDTVPSADPQDPGQSNIDPYAAVTARFDSLLQSSTVNSDTALIKTKEDPSYADTFWWQSGVRVLTGMNLPVTVPTDVPAKGMVVIDHRSYVSSTEYDPFLLSGIQNVYQNCFNPAVGPACAAGPGGPNCCQGVRQGAACVF